MNRGWGVHMDEYEIEKGAHLSKTAVHRRETRVWSEIRNMWRTRMTAA